MEASQTWGFDENEAEIFANDFLEIKKAPPKKLRPENSVFVKPNYCACFNGKPEMKNQCESFCRGTGQGPTLYGSVNIGEKIIFDEALGSFEKWCTADIPGGKDPKCVLEVFDGNNKENLDMIIPPNSNNFEVNLHSLKQNVTYVAKIVETGSNTNRASSNSFQIRRVPPPITQPIYPGPLKITSVSQYACVTRIGESDPANRLNYFDSKGTNHYYYHPRQKPLVKKEPNPFVFCYDINQYGPVDKITFPRLQLIPRVFDLWDQYDIRFSDTNGDGQMDINTLIDQEMFNKWQIEVRTDYFRPLTWPTSPSISSFGSRVSEEPLLTSLGYYMRTFIDPYTGKGKCPTQEDYFSPDVTFQALREVVGVDTEALYIGAREKEILTNIDGTTTEIPPDMLLMKESDLKKIWFYFENDLAIKPDEITSVQNTLHFYYPPSPDNVDPYVRKSHQSLYTILEPRSLTASTPEGEEETGTVQGLPSYDKRFGCIPKGDNLVDQSPTGNPQSNIPNGGFKPYTPEIPTHSTIPQIEPPVGEQDEDSREEGPIKPNEFLYWYKNKNRGQSLTISHILTNETYLRGSLINDFLKMTESNTTISNWQKTYCLVASFIKDGAKQQMRAQAIPITIGNLKDKTLEKILRVDWDRGVANKDTCSGNLPTFDKMGTEVSTTSDAAFIPLELCPICSGSIGSTNISLYFQNLLSNGTSGNLTIANRVPLAQFDPGALITRVDFSNDRNVIKKCDHNFCLENGFDCCVDNQCVKDKMEKIKINQSSPEYIQSQKDIKNDPSKILNYPHLYNICSAPPQIPQVINYEESSKDLDDANLRFKVKSTLYLCQEEGKKQGPDLELICNDKYLCTKLWMDTDPSFNGKCSDLDGKSGIQRYEENRAKIWKYCGCRAEGFPKSADDQRCPDFNLKTMVDGNNINHIVCTIEAKTISETPTQSQEENP